MWKRINRSSERVIGPPILIETTLSEETTSKLTDLHRMHGGYASDIPSDSDSVGSLYGTGNNPHKHTMHSYNARPVSSIYSQPSPEIRQGHFPPPRLEVPRSSSIYPDVSPPDSPWASDVEGSSSPNISPVTETGSVFRGQAVHARAYTSSIPLPKQGVTSGAASYIAGWRDKVNTLDATSRGSSPETVISARSNSSLAEPVRNRNRGVVQIAPAPSPLTRAPSPFDHPSVERGTVVTTISSQSRSPSMFTSKLRKAVGYDTSPAQPAREDWRGANGVKGASGRTATVAPMLDKPNPHGQKTFPTPKERRKQQGAKVSGRTSPGPSVGLGGLLPRKEIQSRVSIVIETTSALPYGSNEKENIYSWSESPASTAPTHGPSLSQRMFGSENQSIRSPLARNPSHETLRDNTTDDAERPKSTDRPPRISSLVIEPTDLAEDEFGARLDIYNEPRSRFSATTYNTAVIESPPDTPRLHHEESVPPLPSSPPKQSILNRKRPVAPAGMIVKSSTAKTPTRKPTPSSHDASGPTDVAPTSPPADSNPVDRVRFLEEKLSTLNKRKKNLYTVIHELTNVVQPSSIAYDMASRQEIKKTVQGLNTEEAAIVKEIHETGLQLHRALKKRDNAGMYEPTGLWVRRVTE